VLAQREYSAKVTIDSCLFDSNLSPYGGGAHVALFADIGSSEVVFSNCNFTGNGLINLTDGGGIAVLGNLVRLSKFSSVCCQGYEQSQVLHTAKVNIKVDLANFKNNIAYAGGELGKFNVRVHKEGIYVHPEEPLVMLVPLHHLTNKLYLEPGAVGQADPTAALSVAMRHLQINTNYSNS